MKKFHKFDIGSVKPIKPKVVTHTPRPKFFRQLILFAVSAILIVSVVQAALYLSSAKKASGEILGTATVAYDDLNNAGKNLSSKNFTDAAVLFESAQSNVKLAQEKLNNFKPLTWISDTADSADRILAGAGYLALGGEKLTDALDLFEGLSVTSSGVETSDFHQKLSQNRNLLGEARDLIYKSAEEFNSVESIPLDYQETLTEAKNQVAQLGFVLDKLVGLEDLYLNLFDGEKTNLLVFQNYDEQRATGGFLGTYGVLKTNYGQITKLEIDSIYDLDSRIYEQVAAPGPFQPEIKRWGIRDANWFADFPTTAKKLLYFFEKGQQTADGVISFTPKVFEDLLDLVGPIAMPAYDVILTSENFQQVVQYKTSEDYDLKLNEPKKMLADLAPQLLDRLKNLPQEQWLSFFQIMQNNLNQRHILIFSRNEKTQGIIENLGFSGKILSTEHDYLAIINSNLGGTKTDLEIDQSVILRSKVLSDSSIINTLIINRKNLSFENNKSYVRILVPQGSELVSAKGFDPYPMFASVSGGLRTDPDLEIWDVGEIHSDIFVRVESGKTEFAGWIETQGNREREVTVTYMLPFKVNNSYSLLLQKQAGSKPIDFVANLSLGKYSAKWVSSGVSERFNSLFYTSNTNSDDFFGAVVD
jgi:hypothetical protein